MGGLGVQPAGLPCSEPETSLWFCLEITTRDGGFILLQSGKGPYLSSSQWLRSSCGTGLLQAQKKKEEEEEMKTEVGLGAGTEPTRTP